MTLRRRGEPFKAGNSHEKRLGIVVAVLLVGWQLFESTAAAQRGAGAKPKSVQGSAAPAAKAKKLEPSEVHARTLRGTCWIHSDVGTGTGWVCDTGRKLVITNQHVVGRSDTVKVYFPVYRDGDPITEARYYRSQVKPIMAAVLDLDVDRDLALLQLPSLPNEVAALKLAKKSPKSGSKLHVVGGLPNGSEALWGYKTGSVSGVYTYPKIWAGRRWNVRVVENNVPTNAGNSGGPVVNDAAELVAVVKGGWWVASQNEVAYFIDVTEVRGYLDEIDRLIEPTTAEKFNTRGNRYYGQKRYSRALNDFTRATQLDPKKALYVANRGWALLRSGDGKTALLEFDQALKLNPDQANAYWGRGIVHRDQGDYKTSLRNLTEAIRRDTSNGDLYYDRGKAHQLNEDYKDAEGDYSRAIKLQPKDAWNYYGRGYALLHQDQTKEALRDFQAAVERDGRTARFHNAVGRCQLRLSEPKLAVSAFATARKLDSKDAVYCYNHGLALKNLGAWKEAVQAFSDAIARNKKDADFFHQRGLALDKLDLCHLSNVDYAKAAQLDPKKHGHKWQRRYLRVHNDTNETLKVCFQYYTKGTDGRERWYPGALSTGKYRWQLVGPGKNVQLYHGQLPVYGSKVRVWATSQTTDRVWTENEDKDLNLVADGEYTSAERASFTLRFYVGR